MFRCQFVIFGWSINEGKNPYLSHVRRNGNLLCLCLHFSIFLLFQMYFNPVAPFLLCDLSLRKKYPTGLIFLPGLRISELLLLMKAKCLFCATTTFNEFHNEVGICISIWSFFFYLCSNCSWVSCLVLGSYGQGIHSMFRKDQYWNLDIVGLGVFNYDFGSVTKESPVIKVWWKCYHNVASVFMHSQSAIFFIYILLLVMICLLGDESSTYWI